MFAKYAKDVAAGAVLIVSTTASIVGLIIFVPKLLVFIDF
ncbi:MAG: diacylglycerol kinase [Candidatus Paceibacterota bacterium]